jgi:hypothetical protein
MGDWWRTYVVDAGKLPLMLCALAFVVTFVGTRVITRMIRAGRGPFRDNVGADGTHVHHAVYGIVLLITGALIAVGAGQESVWRSIAGVLVGAGASLVLDEFALILHLKDVYWAQQGRLSVQMISLTAACLLFALIGVLPFGIDDRSRANEVANVLTTGWILHAVLLLTCVAKGKYSTALFGTFMPVVAWVGAFRIGRPESWWAKHRYKTEKKRAKAERRAEKFDRRWDPVGDRLANFVAGRPTAPAVSPTVPANHA